VVKGLFAFIARHERSLSAVSMIGGFAFDNYAFRRIDLPNTQLVFIGYLSLAAISMLILHVLAERVARGKEWPRWRALLPFATQFALGGLWSAFLVFYSRSAVLTASWPFLIVLLAIFLGNEFFKHYHSRLAFAAVLFFFALYSYCTVTVPLVTHSVGVLNFLLAGAVALFIFFLLMRVVAGVGPQQWRESRLQVGMGVVLVYALMNIFYFAGVLPPLPIALSAGGVYHFVAKTGDRYKAVAEPQSWTVKFGAPAIMHVKPGEPLYVYSAVFAPVKLDTKVQHRWQRYDAAHHSWRTISVITYAINGGRDGGYRGYTLSHHIVPGQWRVDVDLPDGHIIGRIRFDVAPAAGPVQRRKKMLG
jgi:MFS family permease